MKALRDLVDEVGRRLATDYSGAECKGLARLLCDEVAPNSYYTRLAGAAPDFTAQQAERLEDLLCQLEGGRPVQYVLGSADFCGLTFRVDERVLIPRPETEELVLWVAEEARKMSCCSLLDVGTGSGAIAIALASMLGATARVQAWDVSDGALAVAADNGLRCGVEVEWCRVDVLHDPLPQLPCFDIVVSNPPYVMRREEEEMAQRVKRFEPSVALFVEDHDPLLFYRVIGEAARRMLTPKGVLYFEINALLVHDTVLLLQSLGYDEVECKNDMFGKPRMVRARL